MLVVIDNYDSFTYNLVHYFETYLDEVKVLRNDEFDLEDLKVYSHIVISPGPGLPNEHKVLSGLIERYAATKHILGVCLGFQAIVEYFGGELENLDHVLHGRRGNCFEILDDGIFDGIESPFQIGHYHSWIARKNNFPTDLQVLGEDESERIMVFRHKEHSIYAVQFHPESVLCPSGKHLIENWLKETGAGAEGVLPLDLKVGK